MLMIRIVVIHQDQEDHIAGEADLEIKNQIIKRDDIIVLSRHLPQEKVNLQEIMPTTEEIDENLHINVIQT